MQIQYQKNKIEIVKERYNTTRARTHTQYFLYTQQQAMQKYQFKTLHKDFK